MKYKKYKEFLPDSIRSDKVSKINKSIRRTIVLLLILNSILLPLNLKKINCGEENQIEKYNVYDYENKVETIKNWIDMSNDYVSRILVENGEGELYLKDRSFAYNVDEKKFRIRECKVIDNNTVIKVIKR